MTTRLEKAGIIGSIIGVIITLCATGISYLSLSSEIENNKLAVSSEAANFYLNSPSIIPAKEVINAKTNNGKDYRKVGDDVELYSAVRTVLNHLEVIASRINSGLYDDSLVCRDLKDVVIKQFEVHVKGQTANGVQFANPQPFSSTQFPELNTIYVRWSRELGCS